MRLERGHTGLGIPAERILLQIPSDDDRPVPGRLQDLDERPPVCVTLRALDVRGNPELQNVQIDHFNADVQPVDDRRAVRRRRRQVSQCQWPATGGEHLVVPGRCERHQLMRIPERAQLLAKRTAGRPIDELVEEGQVDVERGDDLRYRGWNRSLSCAVVQVPAEDLHPTTDEPFITDP